MHYGHGNIIGFADRPFNDVNHMNEMMIKNWNDTVTSDDEVWVVGDAFMGVKSDTIKYIPRLLGKITLIVGNHDPMFREYGYVQFWEKKYYEQGIDTIIHTGAGKPPLYTDLGPHRVQVSHFPYEGDSHEKRERTDRWAAYRPEDDGSWLIHGHVHTSWLQQGRQINVGVDMWDFTPVPEAYLIAMIDRGPENHYPHRRTF